MAFTEKDTRRFMQLIGMSESVHDGEAINALRLARRLAGEHRLTLLEALRVAAKADLDMRRMTQIEDEAYARGYARGVEDAKADRRPPPVATPSAPPLGWQLFAKHCLAGGCPLTPWEVEFCRNFIDRGFPTPTPKQHAIFVRLSKKCGMPLE